MTQEIRYVRERNDSTGPKKHEAVTARTLVGLWLCLLFVYATKGGSDTKLTADHDGKDLQPTPSIVDSFLNFVTDQSNASQFFIHNWERHTPEEIQMISHQLENLCRDIDPSYKRESDWG